MTATMPDPEAERAAHGLGGCQWGPWYMGNGDQWTYWRRCEFEACDAHEFCGSMDWLAGAPKDRAYTVTPPTDPPSLAEVIHARYPARLIAGAFYTIDPKAPARSMTAHLAGFRP